MKILYFSPHPNLNLASPSGYGRHMREMIKAFQQLGHEVETLIIGGESLETIGKSKSVPSRIKKIVRHFTPTYFWESLKDRCSQKIDKKNASQLIQKIKTFQPDLVYERCAYFLPCGAIICKELKVKHILECNAPIIAERVEFQGKSLYLKKASALERIQMKASNLVLFVSSALKDYYQARYELEEKNIMIVPNAVSSESYSVDSTALKHLKTKYELNNFTVIGFLGSILPYHGIEELLDAFKELTDQKPASTLKLMIVGGGETLQMLKRRSHKLNITSKVIFTGNVPHNEVFNYINSFDIAVLPNTNWYCSPIKIFEYGYAKKAIVAIKKPGVTDVIIDGKDGLLFEKKEGLVSCLSKLANDHETREKLALNFYNKVNTDHTWIKTAEKVLKGIEAC